MQKAGFWCGAVSALILLGCSSCGAPQTAVEASGPTYDLHEWGLVRGTPNDGVMISGSYALPPAMPVAKPVLYFHRHGDGELNVDVDARIVNGRIVEHWPTAGGDPGGHARWEHVSIGEASCTGRYPSMIDDPCSHVSDGCEAATLATVETDDSSCVFWPDAAHRYNSLFYRGEVNGAPPLPLAIESQADHSVRVTSRSREAIPGRLIVISHSNGITGYGDGVAVAAPPGPGQSVTVTAPGEAMSIGIEALSASLREAGLTNAEIAAFHCAWDEPIFHIATAAANPVPDGIVMLEARPVAPMRSILYVLPISSADQLATLTLNPPPITLRRAIVAWIDLPN